MASQPPPFPLADLPDDIQLNILSFLTPPELSAFACTSRRSASLTRSPTLWLSICDRRWGSHTSVRRWTAATPAQLYRSLSRWDHLIGFWRRIGHGAPATPPLVFFQWAPSSLTASRVSPDIDPTGSYAVVKTPFLWMSLSPHGEPVSYLSSTDSTSDPVPVTISFMGSSHFVVEENRSFSYEEEELDIEGTSPPDCAMSEVYQYFANRTSPGGDKASRKQRRKKGRQLLGRRRWESEHFVKIENYHPKPGRPLQGLWKGICESMSLDFYLVAYDDIGGITCRRVGDAVEPFSSYTPVFWTSYPAFLEPPFAREEQELYASRRHIQPSGVSDTSDMEVGRVSRILCINSSYDLVIPDGTESSGDFRNVEGRIWVYENGEFGFGFLRNNFLVDMKHIAVDGRLLDAVEHCFDASNL